MPTPSWLTAALILLAGLIAGFVNTLAGSGSLVSLPVLIFAGLPATVANGTNRIAILLQNIVAVYGFRRQGALDPRGAAVLGLPALLGALAGAQIAANLDETTMERAIGVVMVVMLFVILLKPRRWLEGQLTELRGRPPWWLLLLFFAVGVYGGFIQAGVGIFLLAGLVLGAGYNLVRANAVKVAIVLLFTVAALFVFIRNDQVNWPLGLLLGAGNMAGAWLGTRFAARGGAVWVRRLLIAIVLVSAMALLGLDRIIIGLF